jgi:S1-C subfamily serine protease
MTTPAMKARNPFKSIATDAETAGVRSVPQPRFATPARSGGLITGARHRLMAWILAGLVMPASSYLVAATAHAATPSPAKSLSQVVKRVDPAVVVIRTSEHVPADIPGLASGTLMNFSALGSGVLVSTDGKVVTAAHVVQTADKVDVEFLGGTVVPARIVASDEAADVALLQLDWVPPYIVPARFGNSDKVEVGDQVFIVGAPLGIGHTLTVGHVSARRQRNATYSGLVATESFQTDAAINRGNSGGPMFDMNGEVVGIVTHIVSVSGGSEGLGFVVTSNMAHRLLFEEPSVWSGLDGYLLTGKLAHALNLPTTGLLVQRVANGSPAERLGLRAGYHDIVIGGERLRIGGDVILAVDGIALADPDAYERVRRRLADARTSGGAIRLSVMRDGLPIELKAGINR